MSKFIIFLSCVILSACSQKVLSPFSELSKSIINEFKDNGFSNDEIKVISKARGELEKNASLSKLMNSREIFTLEYYDYQNGTIYGRIWSDSDTLNYSYVNYKKYRGERLKLNPLEGICCDNIFELVSKWDIERIKEQKSAYPEQIMYVSKISKSPKKEIKVGKFKMF